MKNLFKRLREIRNFTNFRTEAFIGTASGVNINQTAALEIAASTISKSFAAMQVKPVNQITEAITPEILGIIGRRLIQAGEALFYIEVGSTVKLIPVAEYDISGDYRQYRYSLSIWGPSMSWVHKSGQDGVCHFKYSVDPSRPWCGVGPLGWSKKTADLHSESESALLDESKSPRGSLIPIPRDAKSDTLDDLKDGIRNLNGNVAFVPGNNSLGEAQGLVRKEYETKRLGFNAPPTLIDIHSQSFQAVLASCGIPIELVTKSGDSGQRESWRRYLFGTVEPLKNIVQAEMRLKLDVPDLELITDNLFASDLAGRARAFGSMVQAGMELDKAAQLAGLVSEND